MASELTNYFVRHYTLVIDNDQSSYDAATRVAKRVVRKSGITRAEWLALSTKEREERFAGEIGDEIMDLVNAWFTEAVVNDSIGGMLAHEVMVLADSEIQWYLGKHYTPEDADIVDLLDDEDDEDDDQ